MNRSAPSFTPRLECLDDRAVPALLSGLGSLFNPPPAPPPQTGPATLPTQEEATQAEVAYESAAGTWGGQGNPNAMTPQEQATQAEIDYLNAQNPR